MTSKSVIQTQQNAQRRLNSKKRIAVLQFKILKESSLWVAIDKPAGFHTHPPEDKNIQLRPRWNALGVLERQLQQKLFPVHRLDRATSGVLLFSKDRDANAFLHAQFEMGKVRKSYFAVLRGKLLGDILIESPLKNEAGNLQEALTYIRPHFYFQLPLPHPNGGDRWFTIVEAEPHTGRFHQIRRHLAGLGFPLIGDSRHGDKKLNREFSALTSIPNLLLRSMALEFLDPSTGENVMVHGLWNRHWHKLFDQAGGCAYPAKFGNKGH